MSRAALAARLAAWVRDRTQALLLAGYVRREPDEFKASVSEARRNAGSPVESPDRFFQSMEQGWSHDVPARISVPAGFFVDNTYLRQGERADWQSSCLEIQVFAARLIEVLRRRGVPVYAHTVYRSREAQTEIFRAGNSRAQWPDAPHCRGGAVDIVHSVHHWELTKAEWALIGKLGKDLAARLGIRIEWGGDWRFYDPAHWQVAWWRSLPLVVEGEPVRVSPRALTERLRHHSGLDPSEWDLRAWTDPERRARFP